MAESKKTIRVLHYIGRLGSGGVEKLLVSLLENLDRDVIVFDFLLWNNSQKGFYDDYVQKIGAQLFYLNLDEYDNKAKRAFMKAVKLYSFLKRSDYSVLHLHGTQPMQYIYAFLAKKAGVKTVIIHAHNTQSLTGLRTKVLPVFKTLFWKYPSYYLACSQEVADYMWPKGLTKDNGCVLINGIDFSKYNFSEDKRRTFRRENNIEDKFVVGHIGRFAKQKNHRFLLDVFYQVQKRITESVLLLIGEGKLEFEIRRQAEELGIDDKIIFFGTTKDVPSALMGMDVMCFPSLYEGLGIVAVEAQAASLNVIVSEGVPDSANISSYYHKLSLSDSENLWADEVCSFINNSNRNSNMQCFSRSQYDIRETACKLLQIYRNLEEEG